MASAWGSSWGNSWGNSWGSVSSVEGDNYYDRLGSLGYKGSLMDRQMAYLGDLGYQGANSKRSIERLKGLGYTGSITNMMKQKSVAEGFDSVGQMMVKTGLIEQ